MNDALVNCLLSHENVGAVVRSRSDLFVSAASASIPLGSPANSSPNDADKMDDGQEERGVQRTTTHLLALLDQVFGQVNPLAVIVALQLHISKITPSNAESYVKVGQKYLMNCRDKEGIRSIISDGMCSWLREKSI